VAAIWQDQKIIQPSTAWASLLPKSVSPAAKPAVPDILTPSNRTAEPSPLPRLEAAALLKAAGMTVTSTSSTTMAPAVFVEPPIEVSREATQAVEATASPQPPAPLVKVTVAPEVAPAQLAQASLPRNAADTTVSVAPETAATLKRAQALIERGDIAGARLLLERAASGKEPRVLMALGETYDSAMLSRWGARGIKSDAAKARELYQKAAEAGLAEARTRVLAGR
jgi:TPR repeat protein